MEHQRVTMRTLSSVTAKQIAEAIEKNTNNMEARLVTKNKLNQEFLVKLVSFCVMRKKKFDSDQFICLG